MVYRNQVWSTHAFPFNMHANKMGNIEHLMVTIKIFANGYGTVSSSHQVVIAVFVTAHYVRLH